ncbi:unnamed protein product, partial [Staurois parvus]
STLTPTLKARLKINNGWLQPYRLNLGVIPAYGRMASDLIYEWLQSGAD